LDKKKTYSLDYEGKTYVCPNKEYPYPGFTNENIVCCFKKDQRRRQAFARNMQSSEFDILVQPSNFKIKINKNLETYAIKVVSEYEDGFDETNSMSRYYYIDQNNSLVEITNDKLIEQLSNEEDNNIWLEKMPLVKLITEPPKNKCNFPPDMTKKDDNDINAPCLHHKKNNIFGYNLNAYPCCFDKPRETVLNRKRKASDITKQHILTSDKILDYERIGTLPEGLEQLFNQMYKRGKTTFYRMGVVQNNSAFINAVLLALSNEVGGQEFNNSNEFKRYIMKYLRSSDTFDKLNGGNISMKYKTVENYEKMLMSKPYYRDIIDLVQRMSGTNVLIVDIPYKFSDSNKVADYENMKLICTPQIQMQMDNPFMILLKKQETFEIVIAIDKSETDVQIDTIFYESDDKIVKFFTEYYNSSCVKENVFPEMFPYDELVSLAECMSFLSDSDHVPIAQVVNAFNKVTYIYTKKGVLVPVKESGILDVLKAVTLQQLADSGKLLDLSKTVIGIKRVNDILNKSGFKFTIQGATTNGAIYTSVLTNFGQFVPVAPSQYNPNDDVRVLDVKYYMDVDDVLQNGTSDNVNDQQKFYANIKDLKQKIYEVKTALASKLPESSKTEIQELNTNTEISRQEKLNKLMAMFSKFVSVDDYILQYIANEVLNDNLENLLLNNMVTSDVFNPNEIISRDDETLVVSISDIKKWLQRHERSEI
jgi:hypothetical protein